MPSSGIPLGSVSAGTKPVPWQRGQSGRLVILLHLNATRRPSLHRQARHPGIPANPSLRPHPPPNRPASTAKLFAGWFPCKKTVGYMVLPNGRSVVMFEIKGQQFSFSGGQDRQPDLNDLFLTLDTVRILKGGKRSSGGLANWRLRSGRRLTGRSRSDACLYRRPTASSGRRASRPCGTGSA